MASAALPLAAASHGICMHSPLSEQRYVHMDRLEASGWRRVEASGGGVGLEGLLQDLRYVEHLHALTGGAVGLFGGDGVGEHDHAERAGGGDEVGVEAEGFFGAFDVDSFSDFFFHPESGAAGAAAEAALFAAVHFFGGEGRYGVEDLPRGGVDLVVPPEVARVVVGDGGVEGFDRGESPVGEEAAEQFGVVEHVEMPAESWVSTFCMPSIWNRKSLPSRRAGSPVQVSAAPRMAKFTPAVCRSSATARVTFFDRSSNAPAQPTQNR